MDKKRAQIMINVLIAVLSLIWLCVNFSLFALFIFLLSIAQFSLLREVKARAIGQTQEKISPKEKKEELKVVSDGLDFPDGFDEKAFAKSIFLLYRDIQTDLMNFEYDGLMQKLGIEMYNQFSKQMRHLEESGRQSVRNNIELQKIQIMSFNQGKDENLSVVHLSVLEDKYIKRKDESLRLTSVGVRYESCYALTVAKNHRKKIVKKCNNCNEKIQGNLSVCPACGAMLLESSDNWILKDLKLVCSHSYTLSKKA